MKYCIFSAQYLPHLGGVERYTHQLAKKLVEKGHEVTIVTSQGESSLAHEKQDGIRIYRVPCLSLMDGRYPVLLPNRQFRKINRMAGGRQYDMVIVNTRFYIHSLYGALFAKWKNTRCIFIEHGTGHMTMNQPILNLCENLVEHLITAMEKRLCKEFYGVSAACLDWLKHFHIQGKGTLYNAVDLKEIERKAENAVIDYREQFQIPGDAVVVAFTGRLLKEKGILSLIQAVRELNQKYPDLYLLIAGDGGEEKTVMASRTRSIIPLGRINADEVAALLKVTDIFCFPTGYPEGLPTSILEAAACHNYVITTDKGGAKEVIPNKEYGMIIEDNSLETIKSALEKAIQHPEERKHAAELCYQRLQQIFTWDIVAENVINLTK